MNPSIDPGPAAKKIADFLQTVTTTGGLSLKFEFVACNTPSTTGSAVNEIPHASSESTQSKRVCVEFSGPDTPILLARNGELLHALEHVAAKILRFEPEEHDRISFDAENFKVLRDRELHLLAEAAIEKVRSTGRPHVFPPMTSRERRMLHLALAGSGLSSASSGEGPRRFVVLYPEGQQPAPASPAASSDRTSALRKSFRRR